MKYNDLEKTKDLFDIVDVPSPIENIEMEGATKDNLSKDLEEFTLSLKDKREQNVEEKKKKSKKSLKEIWTNLSKKKKIIFIVSVILLVLILIGIILFFVLKKEDKPKDESEKPEVPTVIVEKENYIYKDGVLSFVDESGNTLGTYECKNKKENLCYVEYYNTEDEFDEPKTVFEDGTKIKLRSKIYKNKYVFIYDNKGEKNGVISLYNLTTNKSEGAYKTLKGSDKSDYVILKNNNNKYGAIEFTDEGIKEKVNFTFDYLGKIDSSNKLVASSNNKYFIYSSDGKLESKGLSYEIKSYNNKYIVAFNDGYYVYDYKGKLVINGAYDYASLLDEYVVLIKDQKLYIKDYEDNKYNENGIKLDNKYYNPTSIYDENKVLVESNKAYDVNIEDNTLVVTYKNKNTEKTESINLNEGKFSKTISYLNYFNGNLYFYSDEEETKLLGNYTCANKNNIDKDTKELSNCLIASDTQIDTNEKNNLGWIPIFNERYVFITDYLDKNNQTIILYDLKSNKTLSKYNAVDTSSYTKENKVTFKKTSATYIIGENKNNKYGVIKIEEEVKGLIPFNYNKIEVLKDYYLAEEDAGAYALLDKSGKEVTSKYGYRIVDYKGEHLKVINDDKYYVYDFKGNKIDETGYLDITLYDDFYVVVTSDNKLDIHKYNDSEFKLSPEGVISVSGANDYEVSANTKGFIIKVKSTNSIYNTDLSGNLATTEE